MTRQRCAASGHYISCDSRKHSFMLRVWAMIVLMSTTLSIVSTSPMMVEAFTAVQIRTVTSRNRRRGIFLPSLSSTTMPSDESQVISASAETAMKATTTAPIIQQQANDHNDQKQINDSKKSYLDDGFVFGLNGSGLERPKGKTAVVVVEGDSLETQPYQIAMVVTTFLAHFGFAVYAFLQMLNLNHGSVMSTTLQAIALTLSSWITADLGSGILHWSVDNYGNGRTPVMGSIIAAFQGHHSAPWTITERGFCNNVYKLCIPFGIIPMSMIALLASPSTTFFMTVFCVFEILSQEFHKWSHMTKGQCPSWVNALQNVGFTVGRKPHALHHMEPYEGNYCIISGICNSALDRSGFFRRLEHLIYRWNGVESNAWKLDPKLKERTLKGDYQLLVKSKK